MSDKKDVAIRIKNVSKDFHLPHEKQNSVKGIVVNLFKPKDKEIDTQHVLRNISFDIHKGEFLGIVGRNGSGKSTLLKIISEIYRPTSGSVEVVGKLVPFIELGVGFNPELTGRENIYLNGALLGFSRKEVEEKYNDIVDFAELEDFMDQKLKNYSSGMQVRLAFSVAIRAEGDILILDEVLAVGDEAFQRKCYDYFSSLKREGKTVVLVTHSMDTVQRFCTRAVLIDKGSSMKSGNPAEIAQIYRELNDQDEVTVNKTNLKSNSGTRFVDVRTVSEDQGDNIDFEIIIRPKSNLEDPIIGFEIFRDTGEQVYRWVTDEKLKDNLVLTKDEETRLSIKLQNIFPVGKYSVRILVRRKDRSSDYGIFNDSTKFEIKNKSVYQHGILWRPHEQAALEKINGK